MSSKLLCEFKLDDIPETLTEVPSEEPTVVSEPVYQHQQKLDPIPSKTPDKVQFNLENNSEKAEPQISTLPAVSPVGESSQSAGEEIKRLKARLAEALKQI